MKDVPGFQVGQKFNEYGCPTMMLCWRMFMANTGKDGVRETVKEAPLPALCNVKRDKEVASSRGTLMVSSFITYLLNSHETQGQLNYSF